MTAERGRGTGENPTQRFASERLELEPDEAARDADHDGAPVATEFFRDLSKSALTRNDSPDVGFEWSLNPYRGCEHGCAYCYARPSHEFLNLSPGLDFETKIFVKEKAPELLRRELMHPRWRPQVVMMSGITDCYQPVERRLGITRRCLEVLAEFRNPVSMVTKNALVERDADVLAELARHGAAQVSLSVTTLDESLAARLEPRASTPRRRLDAITALANAGVPVNVMMAPLIPGLTDHEAPAILRAAKDAGAQSAAYVLLRLPYAVKDLFREWLEREVPLKRDKIIHRIESARGGRLNDPRFGTRMSGEGPVAREVADLFEFARERAGLASKGPKLSAAAFRRPGPTQGTLF